MRFTFEDRLFSEEPLAFAAGQELSNLNNSPVAVLMNDDSGLLALCDEPPDDIEPSPLDNGWIMFALIEPQEAQ